MFHPLLGDLSKLKDSEVENKVLELTSKYHSALRLGMGSAAHQIIIALDQYREELNTRQQNSLKKTMDKVQNKDLDNLINVN
jgi:hypothetical protein